MVERQYRARQLRQRPELARGNGNRPRRQTAVVAVIRVHRCSCPRCKIQGRHFWLVTIRADLPPIVLNSFRDAINTADHYAHRRAAA